MASTAKPNGYHLDTVTGEFVHFKGTEKDSRKKDSRLVKVPAPFVAVAAPVLSVAYVIFLPLTGIVTFFAFIGMKVKGLFRKRALKSKSAGSPIRKGGRSGEKAYHRSRRSGPAAGIVLAGRASAQAAASTAGAKVPDAACKSCHDQKNMHLDLPSGETARSAFRRRRSQARSTAASSVRPAIRPRLSSPTTPPPPLTAICASSSASPARPATPARPRRSRVRSTDRLPQRYGPLRGLPRRSRYHQPDLRHLQGKLGGGVHEMSPELRPDGQVRRLHAGREHLFPGLSRQIGVPGQEAIRRPSACRGGLY